MATSPFSFPPDFKFGCATSSYQVEGAARTDGRGPSIWDTFCREPGRVMFDHNGDVAVDQYHRYRDDVRSMQWLGVKMYRFSISWSRVLPTGRGQINEAGLDYYSRLTDELLAAGIEPWATLFHWDLPQGLQDDFGGWQSAETAKYFGEYAALISQRLSDRIKNFFTINEFFCFTDKGYAMGDVFDAFAPGLKLPPSGRNQVRHHALLAHGLAAQALRQNAKSEIKVGLAENAQVCCPVIETPANIAAARTAFRELNGAFLTAVMEGAYPASYLKAEGADAPRFTEEEMKIIGTPLDFVGLNMYAPTLVRASDKTDAGFEVVPVADSHPKFLFDWLRLGPEITYWSSRFVKELWNVNEVYITENGCAGDDKPTRAGEILDTDRVLYLRQHLISATRAVAEGWPLKGYFAWSLLDNFEWAHGYIRRFGLFYVNFTTLERTPKLSAEFLRETIRQRSVA
jgi:beta-glucosidase